MDTLLDSSKQVRNSWWRTDHLLWWRTDHRRGHGQRGRLEEILAAHWLREQRFHLATQLDIGSALAIEKRRSITCRSRACRVIKPLDARPPLKGHS